MTKTAIVWTKTSSNPSREAVLRLRGLGYTVDERNVSLHRPWTNADLKAAIPGATTVPQIVIDDVLLGGLAAIDTLPEAQAEVEARTAARASVANRSRSAQAQAQTKTNDWAANRAAARASRLEAVNARKAAWQQAKLNPTNTRAERHAAEDAKVKATLDRRAAAIPPYHNTPEGYQAGAPRTATPDVWKRRFAEQQARELAGGR
jgi:glutaredoxin